MRDPPAPPRWRRWAKRVLLGLGAVVVLVAAANVYLIGRARAATVADPASASPRPYAIVLGNHVFHDGTPSDELAARLQSALELYRAGRAGKLIMSGRTSVGYDEPHAMGAWLQARGVPPADIIIDGGGHRTAATMADAAALGVQSAFVVSQGYHLPRALYYARHAGIDALGVAAPSRHTTARATLKVFFREAVARPATLVEVALRGVR